MTDADEDEPTGSSGTVAADWALDDYTQGLRVERDLSQLEAIRDPIERVHAANDLADQAREVQGSISRIRRQAIYEATLRAGHTGESVAAELGISAKAVSAAVSEFRAQDRKLFKQALEILMRDGVTNTPADQLKPGIRAREVLVQARLVALGLQTYDPGKVDSEEFALLSIVDQRVQQIHHSAGREAPSRPNWERRALDDMTIDWDRVPSSMADLARVFDVLPGIAPLWFGTHEGDPAPSASTWSVGWAILPAEKGAKVFDAGPHRDGYLMTEWLVWFVKDFGRAEYRIWCDVHSPPPYLNEPGESLFYVVTGDLRGERPVTPDQFARQLVATWGKDRETGTGFVDIDWPEFTTQPNDDA